MVKAVFCYFKEKIKGIILFFLLIAVLFIVYALYRLSLEPFIYSVCLVLVVGSIVMAVDFLYYYKKHKILLELFFREEFPIEELPHPGNLIEQDYKKLTELIYRDKVKHISTSDSQRREMLEYYTVWAHQIKTPIAAMNLLLQSYESELHGELSGELFKIEQYVEMVLGYLRLRDSASDFIFQEYSLDEIVKQGVRKYAGLFILKKIALDYDPLECNVLTDEKWLLFALEQILSNALKYTRTGKISIYMDKEQEKTLIIEDTGIGIRGEDIPRIFERGFTGYNGRLDKKSTGIGLYLCRRILTRLSHSISIESKVDKGTKVKIQLDTIKLKIE